MSIYFTIRPDDLEPIEYTHFDCWEETDTDETIIQSWEASLGVTLPHDSWDSVIVQLLRKGYSVYEGDGFIEIFDLDEEGELPKFEPAKEEV